MNQHALALVQLGNAMDQLICRGVVQNEADGFGGIETGGNLDQFGFGEDDVARISTRMRQGGDDIACVPFLNISPARFNDADDIVTGRIRQRGNVGIHPATHQNIGERNSARENLNADLVRAWVADVVFDYFQDFGAAESGEEDASVSH